MPSSLLSWLNSEEDRKLSQNKLIKTVLKLFPEITSETVSQSCIY